MLEEKEADKTLFEFELAHGPSGSGYRSIFVTVTRILLWTSEFYKLQNIFEINNIN